MNSIWSLLKCNCTICYFLLFPFSLLISVAINGFDWQAGFFVVVVLLLLCASLFVIRQQTVVTWRGWEVLWGLTARHLSCQPLWKLFGFFCGRKILMYCLITFCYGFPPIFRGNFLSLPRLLFNRDDIVPALLAICSCTTGSFNSPIGC